MRAELSFLTASVIINAAMLYSVDHAALHYEKKQIISSQAQRAKIAKRQSSGPILFEYVEAPKAPARKPASETSRISSQDSINQDRTADKSRAEGPPQTQGVGPADQLAQKEGKPSPPAAPEVKPQAAQREKREAASQSPPKEEAPAVQPSPPAQPSPARDRITTLELSKSKSRGAQIYGLTSFEATGSGMGVYMKNLKERIWLAWFPYLVTHYPRDYKSADAVVSFKLNARGEVKIVELIESQGSPLFASFCMEAVQRAGTFGPLPKEILALVGKDELEIKFVFHYW